jgi:hypothetical protein
LPRYWLNHGVADQKNRPVHPVGGALSAVISPPLSGMENDAQNAGRRSAGLTCRSCSRGATELRISLHDGECRDGEPGGRLRIDRAARDEKRPRTGHKKNPARPDSGFRAGLVGPAVSRADTTTSRRQQLSSSVGCFKSVSASEASPRPSTSHCNETMGRKNKPPDTQASAVRFATVSRWRRCQDVACRRGELPCNRLESGRCLRPATP